MKLINKISSINLIFVSISCLILPFSSSVWADATAKVSTQEQLSWDSSYNRTTKQRFIPVELFTGGKWDGSHKLTLKEATTTACPTVDNRPNSCVNTFVTGPFKTQTNDTKIDWAGDQISYYKRTFSTRRMGDIESHFTINNSKDGLVRIYDKRKRWGNRTYNGLGSKFPLGYWKQGELRRYPSHRPTSIEILELNGPNNCLTFRWIIELPEGRKGRNSDNNYTFCPGRGFTDVSHNYVKNDAKK